VLEILSKNLGNRQAVSAKVFRKFDKRCIFFANVVKHPDGGDAAAEEAHDVTSGSPKLSLQGFRSLHRRLKVLLKQFRENIHTPG
jgi:hypothetical protein